MRCVLLPALPTRLASLSAPAAPTEAAPSLGHAQHRAAASPSAPLAYAWRGRASAL